MKNIIVDGIYSHFANVEDTADFSYAEKQIETYKNTVKIFEKYGFKTSNSGRISSFSISNSSSWFSLDTKYLKEIVPYLNSRSSIETVIDSSMDNLFQLIEHHFPVRQIKKLVSQASGNRYFFSGIICSGNRSYNLYNHK